MYSFPPILRCTSIATKSVLYSRPRDPGYKEYWPTLISQSLLSSVRVHHLQADRAQTWLLRYINNLKNVWEFQWLCWWWCIGQLPGQVWAPWQLLKEKSSRSNLSISWLIRLHLWIFNERFNSKGSICSNIEGKLWSSVEILELSVISGMISLSAMFVF